MQPEHINVGFMNIQSVSKKENIIEALILDNHFDFFCMTETWLQPQGDESRVSQLTPVNHTTQSFPRLTGTHGGISVTNSNLFNPFCSNNYIDEFESFEMSRSYLTLNNVSTTIFCIYRPPPSKKNELTNALLFQILRNF